MKIADIMRKPVIVPPEMTKEELLALAKKHSDQNLFIVADKDNLFLGDIHEDDLFYMVVPNDLYEDIGVEIAFDIERKFFAKTAQELMHKHDITCSPDEDILAVAMRFMREDVTAMPVVNEWGVVRGYVTQGILLRYLDAK